MNIILYPNAKINIGLRILRKREDGYHDIETLFLPLFTHNDILEIVESDRLDMCRYGISYSLPGDDIEGELCVKAYRLLEKMYGIPPVEFHLFKGIPVGAGLGGGSADAAFALKGLNSLFSLGMTEQQLAECAAKIGSDCPFFIYNKPMLGRGRGEILSSVESRPIELLMAEDTSYYIKVVTPDIHISTAMAYAGVVPSEHGSSLEELVSLPINQWKDHIFNDFEESIFKQYPLLQMEKEKLYEQGALYASMSGSGASLFGIFATDGAEILQRTL